MTMDEIVDEYLPDGVDDPMPALAEKAENGELPDRIVEKLKARDD